MTPLGLSSPYFSLEEGAGEPIRHPDGKRNGDGPCACEVISRSSPKSKGRVAAQGTTLTTIVTNYADRKRDNSGPCVCVRISPVRAAGVV